MLPRWTHVTLLIAVLLLPVLISVAAALAWLLSAVGDETGAALTRGLAILSGVAWVVAIVGLVVCQALTQLGPREGE